MNIHPPVSRYHVRAISASTVCALVLAVSSCSGAAPSDEAAVEPITSEAAAEAASAGEQNIDSSNETDEEPQAPSRLAVVDESESVLAIIAEHPDLTTFAELVADFPHQQVFTQARGVTIFAPSDDAFSAMSAEELAALTEDADAFTLFLSAHMSIGSFSLDSLSSTGTFVNAMAEEVSVERSAGLTEVGAAEVTDADLTAANGVIHVIDGTIDS